MKNVYRCYNCGRFLGRDMMTTIYSKSTGKCRKCNTSISYIKYHTDKLYRQNSLINKKNRYNRINKITYNRNYIKVVIDLDKKILDETFELMKKYNNIDRMTKSGLIRTLILEYNIKLKDWIENGA